MADGVDADRHSVDPVDSFVALVGERVRNARQRRRMPRRMLSQLSHVSQRYLAQLENGGGNISIALLKRIADALDYRVEWLISDEDPWNSQAASLAERFRGATADQRARIIRILNPSSSGCLRGNRICLVGLRGAGKSTLGALLGPALDLPFVELNQEIEQQAGMPVEEVLALYGQEGYRRLERQAVENVVDVRSSVVLAVAGGIVSESETYDYLLDNFHTVWLRASPEDHMNRVRAQGDERPMAGNPKAMEDLKSILTSRAALYERAQAIVETSDKTLEKVLGELVEIARGFTAG